MPTMPAAGAELKQIAAFGEVAAGLDAAGLVVEGLVVADVDPPDGAEETGEAADELEAPLPAAEPVDDEPDDAEFWPMQLLSEPD